MLTIDPRAAERIQPELLSGETIHWAAMPNPKKIFHSDDWSTIPFSLLWGGFAIFWEAGVLGYWGDSSRSHVAPDFFALWGIPFVVVGQYLIWGRFFHDAWLKRRTYYALSNRRVLTIQETWRRMGHFVFLEAIPFVTVEEDNPGTIWLGEKLPVTGGRGTPKRSISRFVLHQRVPVLADIDNVNSVHRLIDELRAKALRETRNSVPSPLSYREFSN